MASRGSSSLAALWTNGKSKTWWWPRESGGVVWAADWFENCCNWLEREVLLRCYWKCGSRTWEPADSMKRMGLAKPAAAETITARLLRTPCCCDLLYGFVTKSLEAGYALC